jgi:maltooligosyltrehalose trehalohydrolase
MTIMTDSCLPLRQGACRQADGCVLWRVWAPHCDQMQLVLSPAGQRRAIAMQQEENHCFTHRESRVEDGLRYAYRLPDGQELPDPASQWQPDGVHRASAVLSPGDFRWSDADWQGIARENLVIYELHVGTFTPEGTFAAIVPRLATLRELGVTAIEIMPVAQFPGTRNWGYDGVHPYAAQSSYGGPRGLQELIDAAHREGLAVLLDVVYNHLGPDGNYLARFGPYFTDRYHTPWGDAINYDGPESDAVRQFFLDNARMWIRDFHADGLRLDAVQTIFDFSPRHILADVETAVHEEAARRGVSVHVIAETDQNDIRLLNPRDRGGYGIDAVWADDFHHGVHALLTGERQGYYQDFGQARQLAKALNEAFVNDGGYSRFHRRRHGTCAGDIDRTRFVACIQNHDQVGNRPRGDRLGTLLSPAAQRLACGLLLLSPCTPLLFMGEEYGETRPFPYFCSFDDATLVEAVRRGRREEFAPMYQKTEGRIDLHDNRSAPFLPDPQAAETFCSATLRWQWPDASPQAGMRRLYATLLAARRQWPALRDRRQTKARCVAVGQSSRSVRVLETNSEVHPTELLIVERGGREGIVAIANYTDRPCPAPTIDLGRRTLLLSTAAEQFGGPRSEAAPLAPLLPYEMQIFGLS